jgi:hypothetical protein
LGVLALLSDPQALLVVLFLSTASLMTVPSSSASNLTEFASIILNTASIQGPSPSVEASPIFLSGLSVMGDFVGFLPVHGQALWKESRKNNEESGIWYAQRSR